MIQVGAEITADSGPLERELKASARAVDRSLGGAFLDVVQTAARVARGVGRSFTAAIRQPLALAFSLKAALGTVVAGVGLDRLIRSSAELTVQQRALANQLGITQQKVDRYAATMQQSLVVPLRPWAMLVKTATIKPPTAPCFAGIPARV